MGLGLPTFSEAFQLGAGLVRSGQQQRLQRQELEERRKEREQNRQFRDADFSLRTQKFIQESENDALVRRQQEESLRLQQQRLQLDSAMQAMRISEAKYEADKKRNIDDMQAEGLSRVQAAYKENLTAGKDPQIAYNDALVDNIELVFAGQPELAARIVKTAKVSDDDSETRKVSAMDEQRAATLVDDAFETMSNPIATDAEKARARSKISAARRISPSSVEEIDRLLKDQEMTGTPNDVEQTAKGGASSSFFKRILSSLPVAASPVVNKETMRAMDLIGETMRKRKESAKTVIETPEGELQIDQSIRDRLPEQFRSLKAYASEADAKKAGLKKGDKFLLKEGTKLKVVTIDGGK